MYVTGFLAIGLYLAGRFIFAKDGASRHRSRLYAAAIAIAFAGGTLFGSTARSHDRIAFGGLDPTGTSTAGNTTRATRVGASTSRPSTRVDPVALARLVPSDDVAFGTLDDFDVVTSQESNRPRDERTIYLHFSGWSVGPDRKPGTLLVAIIDKTRRFDVSQYYGLARPDVANALGTSHALTSGYDAIVRVAAVSRGRHTFALALTGTSRVALYDVPDASHDFVVR